MPWLHISCLPTVRVSLFGVLLFKQKKGLYLMLQQPRRQLPFTRRPLEWVALATGSSVLLVNPRTTDVPFLYERPVLNDAHILNDALKDWRQAVSRDLLTPPPRVHPSLSDVARRENSFLGFRTSHVSFPLV